MNILFMGTPEFAVPSLKILIDNIDNNLNVIGVFTQPDKPKGRKYVLTPPPIKVLAQAHNIPVFQPSDLKSSETYEILKDLNPDIIIVVAYGKILTETFLNFPKFGCINIHASLLPKYRGAAPIQYSVLNCEKVTGVTSMYMEKGIDTGDIIFQLETDISEFETASELHDRLSSMGAKVLLKTLITLQKGNLVRIKQDNKMSTYAPVLTKDMCKIDYTKSSMQVHRHIMGLSEWPCSTTTINGKLIKVYRSKLCCDKTFSEPGILLDDKRFVVSCSDGVVEFIEVQYGGSKRMSGEDFLRGHKMDIGTKLI